MPGIDPAYERLFRCVYAPLVRSLTLAADSPEDAADAVQEAFGALHRHWRLVSRYEERATWVGRVVVDQLLPVAWVSG